MDIWNQIFAEKFHITLKFVSARKQGGEGQPNVGRGGQSGGGESKSQKV